MAGFDARCSADPTFAGRFDAQLRSVFALAQPSRQHRNVLCHRDLWFRNIMFTFADADADAGTADFARPLHAVLLDFQHSCYQPPAIDVCQLLHLTTRRAHRQRHGEAHLRAYWQRLRAELAARLPAESSIDHDDARLSWPVFRRSCDELRLFALVFSCVYTPLMYLPAEWLAEFRGAQRVDRAAFVCAVMAQCADYASVVSECCDELIATVPAVPASVGDDDDASVGFE